MRIKLKPGFWMLPGILLIALVGCIADAVYLECVAAWCERALTDTDGQSES